MNILLQIIIKLIGLLLVNLLLSNFLKLLKAIVLKTKEFILKFVPRKEHTNQSFSKNIVKNDTLQVFSIFVGIVATPQSDNLSIGIVNTQQQTVASQSFNISPSSLRVELKNWQKINSSDLDAVGQFLTSHIPNPKIVKVLIEIPSAVLEKNSIYLKLLIYLARQGYCGFEVRAIEENQKVQLGFPYILMDNQEGLPIITTIPEEFRLNAPVKHGVLYLQQGISKAYAKFLLGNNSPSDEIVAVTAALIAANPSLYYFLTSEGLVQSPQDLVNYMNSQQEEPTAVISVEEEVYIIAKTPLTRSERIDKIPLHYAVAKKKHKFLGKNDALKFALLAICKTWKIRLSCMSGRDDYAVVSSSYNYPQEIELYRDYDNYDDIMILMSQPQYFIYNPENELDSWIANALKS